MAWLVTCFLKTCLLSTVYSSYKISTYFKIFEGCSFLWMQYSTLFIFFFTILTCQSVLVCIKALTTSVSKKCLSPKSTRQKNNLLHLCGLNNLGKGTNKTNFLHLCGLNNIVDKEVNIKYYFLHLCGTEFDKRNFFHFCVRQKLPLNNMRFEKNNPR